MRFGNAQALTHRYLYGPLVDQVLVDEVFTAGTGGQRVSSDILWQLADQQGTIRDIVDSSGTLRKHTGYDSFGQVTGEQNYGAAVDALFGYTGQERDAATGLQYHSANGETGRWYDAAIGRWLSEDPIFGPNLYPYVGSDPVNNTDPTGRVQAGNPLQSLYATPSPSDYSAWSRTQVGWSQPAFNGSMYAPSAAPKVNYAWNSPLALENLESNGSGSSFVGGAAWGLGKTVVVGGAAVVGTAAVAAFSPIVAAGAGAVGIGYLIRNGLYNYSDRLNTGQTQSQAVKGAAIDSTPVIGNLRRGLADTDAGTGAPLNLSSYDRGEAIGSGVGESLVIAGGPKLAKTGYAGGTAVRETITARTNATLLSDVPYLQPYQQQQASSSLTPRNAHLAGGTHPVTGIPFDANGYPDFSNVAIKAVKIRQLGNYTTDIANANRAAGLSEVPKGYTWHHNQDGATMELVPTNIHRSTGHTGGVASKNSGG